MYRTLLFNLRSIYGLWHKSLFKKIFIKYPQIVKVSKSLQTLETWISRLKLKDRKADIITCKYILLLLVKQLCLLFPLEVDVPGFHVCSFESERKSHR